MRKRKIVAIADKLIAEHKILLDDIKKKGQGLYVALRSQHTKTDEPFLGAKSANKLTKISTSKPPTVKELKETFGWTAVSLRDFAYNIEAALLEKTLHQKLRATPLP